MAAGARLGSAVVCVYLPMCCVSGPCNAFQDMTAASAQTLRRLKCGAKREAQVRQIHQRLPPGGILLFVTGQREVEGLCRKLRSRLGPAAANRAATAAAAAAAAASGGIQPAPRGDGSGEGRGTQVSVGSPSASGALREAACTARPAPVLIRPAALIHCWHGAALPCLYRSDLPNFCLQCEMISHLREKTALLLQSSIRPMQLRSSGRRPTK